MSEVMTIRVDRKTKARLEKLARATDRSKSYLAAEAIRAYLELNEWQIAEIKAALKEAEAGDFAGAEEVAARNNKWKGGRLRRTLHISPARKGSGNSDVSRDHDRYFASR